MKILIRTIAIIIIAIGLFNTIINSLVTLDILWPMIGLGIITHSGRDSINFNFAFLAQFVFFLFLFIAGTGILYLRKWAVWMLLSLLACNILYGFAIGAYQEIFGWLFGTRYTAKGKFLILVYLFYRKLLIPTLAVIFFSIPKIKQQFR